MNVKNLFDLSGRKALVTGAGRGIGRVMALALADAGCDVSILEINLESAQKVAEEIKRMGRKALALKADVTNKSEVETAFTATAKEFGGLDICLNVAGVCIHQAG